MVAGADGLVVAESQLPRLMARTKGHRLQRILLENTRILPKLRMHLQATGSLQRVKSPQQIHLEGTPITLHRRSNERMMMAGEDGSVAITILLPVMPHRTRNRILLIRLLLEML
jgi:hypothetical protein